MVRKNRARETSWYMLQCVKYLSKRNLGKIVRAKGIKYTLEKFIKKISNRGNRPIVSCKQVSSQYEVADKMQPQAAGFVPHNEEGSQRYDDLLNLPFPGLSEYFLG